MNRVASVQLVGPGLIQNQLCTIVLFVGVVILGQRRSWLEGKIILWLGQISFSLYLVHFPILFTGTFIVFKALSAHLSYGFAALSTSVIMIPITFATAHYFEKYIDRGAIAISRHIGKIKNSAPMKSLEH
jgi:peptidoglycan/LPS O-acetylase OafA/YrhL